MVTDIHGHAHTHFCFHMSCLHTCTHTHTHMHTMICWEINSVLIIFGTNKNSKQSWTIFFRLTQHFLFHIISCDIIFPLLQTLSVLNTHTLCTHLLLNYNPCQIKFLSSSSLTFVSTPVWHTLSWQRTLCNNYTCVCVQAVPWPGHHTEGGEGVPCDTDRAAAPQPQCAGTPSSLPHRGPYWFHQG